MDHFQKLLGQIRNYLFLIIAGSNLLIIGLGLGLVKFTDLDPLSIAIGLVAFGLLMALFISEFSSKYVMRPLKDVWQAVLHVAPGHSSAGAPDLAKVKLGKDLVNTLALLVYQMASQEDPKTVAQHRNDVIQSASIVSHLPLPMFVFNKEQEVVNASDAALAYCNVSSAQLFGKPLYDTINFEFTTQNTLESWIADCQKNKVTDVAYWQRVRVRQPDTDLRQCDIAAYYNRDNASGTEFIVTLFDRTQQYSQDDDNISYVALAVHELRTPITMLRGYIEVFEDELGAGLDAEMTGFMHKMVVSAQQLAAFLNNILNVARIEQNQLTLNLNEASWEKVLTEACNELKLRAQVHDRKIMVKVAPNLPPVAIDHVSIVEVINNLIDNAIKYSQYGGIITVDAHLRKDGYVETTIQDHGVGIPASAVTNLFDKFYRNHRTSGSVGGTGLGLYLSKAIVNAHGGEIWVQSKEGGGSTFGFTLVPASQLAAELKSSDNNGIVRNAHGWIKNHSLYRR